MKPMIAVLSLFIASFASAKIENSGYFCNERSENVMYVCNIVRGDGRFITLQNDGWVKVSEDQSGACFHKKSGALCQGPQLRQRYEGKGLFCNDQGQIVEFACPTEANSNPRALVSPWNAQRFGCFHFNTRSSCLFLGNPFNGGELTPTW